MTWKKNLINTIRNTITFILYLFDYRRIVFDILDGRFRVRVIIICMYCVCLMIKCIKNFEQMQITEY